MTAAAGSFAWHLEQLGEHGCCWVVDQVQCGLLCGHDGGHVPFTPGQFLQLAPMLHPLQALLLRLARWPSAVCPVCGARLRMWSQHWIGLVSWDVGDERRIGTEIGWEFSPCGCEAREVSR